MAVIVLVCGDRSFGKGKTSIADAALMSETLDDIDRLYGIDIVREGCSRGADKMAEMWAANRGKPIQHYPAYWTVHDGCFCSPLSPKYRIRCNYAGLRRNRAMRYGEDHEGVAPDMVIGFHRSFQQSTGTKDMIQLAREAKILNFVFPHHG